MSRQRVENLRSSLGPGVRDGDPFEPPFQAIPDGVAIIPVHEERILRAAPGALARHAMLRHDKGGESGRIFADLDLKIRSGMAGIERTDKWEDGVDDRLTARK